MLDVCVEVHRELPSEKVEIVLVMSFRRYVVVVSDKVQDDPVSMAFPLNAASSCLANVVLESLSFPSKDVFTSPSGQAYGKEYGGGKSLEYHHLHFLDQLKRNYLRAVKRTDTIPPILRK